MKEAAGEANMTVITIVLIAIVLAVGTVVVNTMMDSMAKSSACESAGGTWSGGQCKTGCVQGSNKTVSCSGTMTCRKQTDGSYTCTG